MLKTRHGVPPLIAVAFSTLLLSGTAAAQTTLSNIFAFPMDGLSPNGYSVGAAPEGGITQGADGNYYGTTIYGGSSTCNDGFDVGCGVVFKLTPGGAESVLYSFALSGGGNTALNGGWPVAALTQGPDGNFYGVASAFGDSTAICNTTGGCGTVFRLSPAGAFKLIYAFQGSTGGCTTFDGGQPDGKLLLASNGDFYGVTNQGGCFAGGTAFRISGAGKYGQIHVFQGNNGTTDGANPTGGLIEGNDGYLYGTTTFGGANGAGTIYRMSLSGAVKVLYAFAHTGADAVNGSEPLGGLVQGNDGNLYGVTSQDGLYSGGTMFRITTAGVFTKLYDFGLSQPFTGISPRASLIQASDGNLYGTTWRGGASDDGTVFKATLSGVVTEVSSFNAAATGMNPLASVFQAADGTLITETPAAGPYASPGAGTVVKVSLTLPAPAPILAKFAPTSGAAGRKVTLTGAGFVGATAVAFNGVAASFTVIAPGTIKTAVPAGAATGPIKVSNAGGTATSAALFTVP